MSGENLSKTFAWIGLWCMKKYLYIGGNILFLISVKNLTFIPFVV